jgi:molybdopterin/thiamine biosynthesis adenylyltransferase
VHSLIENGIRFSIDEEARDRGVMKMTLVVPSSIAGDAPIEATATFPDLYPAFRPAIKSEQVRLQHHQDPFGGDLCLIGRGSRLWTEQDTLGWLLREQLPMVLADQPDPLQGEPVTAFLSFLANAALLIDSDLLPPPSEANGTAVISAPFPPPDGTGRWLAQLVEVRWDSGQEQARAASDAVVGQDIDIEWFRLHSAPESRRVETLWQPSRGTKGVSTRAGLSIDYQLLFFPEEHGSDEFGTGIILLLKIQDLRNRSERRRARERGPAQEPLFGAVRAMRMGASDMFARTPEIAALSGAEVVLVGSGAIGSVVAEQLARAGVRKLTIFDGDVLEAGNLVRHSGRVDEVGLGKATAASEMARRTRPGIVAVSIDAQIGLPRNPEVPISESTTATLASSVAEASLVIDATAEIAVHEVLADMARSYATPLVIGEAVAGAWGGSIAYVPPASDACWNCLEYFLQDNAHVLPPSDPLLVQPPGCAEPTFTGAGFDLSEIALHVSRVAVGNLLTPTESVTLDTVALRDSNGRRTLPRWTQHVIQRDARCQWHNS